MRSLFHKMERFCMQSGHSIFLNHTSIALSEEALNPFILSPSEINCRIPKNHVFPENLLAAMGVKKVASCLIRRAINFSFFNTSSYEVFNSSLYQHHHGNYGLKYLQYYHCLASL